MNKIDNSAITKIGEPNYKKVKILTVIHFIAEPLLCISAIILAVMFKGQSWFWMPTFAIIMVYAGCGMPVSEEADNYAKQHYPQCFGKKGRPNNRKIKQLAREKNDEITLKLKRRQTVMFAVFVVCLMTAAVGVGMIY